MCSVLCCAGKTRGPFEFPSFVLDHPRFEAGSPVDISLPFETNTGEQTSRNSNQVTPRTTHHHHHSPIEALEVVESRLHTPLRPSAK